MKKQQVKLFSMVMVVTLALTLVLAACAAPVAAPAAEEAAATEAAPAEAAAEQPAAAGDFKPVWYAPAPHPYFEDVRKGVEAYVAETGIAVEMQIGPDWTQDSQNQRMEALTANGFNAFSVYPADASGANGLYEELTAAGSHHQLWHFHRTADHRLLCRRHRCQSGGHARHRRVDQGDGREGQHHQRARSA